MYIVCLRGGLGNQMFQYALGYALARDTGEKVAFNGYHLDRDHDGRVYSLSNLNISIRTILPKAMAYGLSYWNKLREKYFRCIDSRVTLYGSDSFEALGRNGLYKTVEVYPYYPFAPSGRKIKWVDGFFQSARYFRPYIEELRKEFTVIGGVSPETREMLSRIDQCEAACVHIRRGDYTSGKHAPALNLCGETYFREGMEYIARRVKNVIFFIFSTSPEDIAWIRERYRFNYPVVYVDLNNPDYSDLLLMSSCKHFILSNSSYSYWAAMLSRNENKITIVPDRWRVDALSSDADIYETEWVRLHV